MGSIKNNNSEVTKALKKVLSQKKNELDVLTHYGEEFICALTFCASLRKNPHEFIEEAVNALKVSAFAELESWLLYNHEGTPQ